MLQKETISWDKINAFLRLTWRKSLFAILFFLMINQLVVSIAKEYLSEVSVPPSFRHMDRQGIDLMISDYLDAKKVNAENTLVIGDCVTFGHGVKKSFVNYLNSSEKVVNLSMQEYPHSLFLHTLEHAKNKGVRKFIFQLHPFQHYFNVPFFENLENFFSGENLKLIEAFQKNPESLSRVETERVFRIVRTESRNFFKVFGTFPDLDQKDWARPLGVRLTGYIRRAIQYIPLYHFRFIIDHSSGLERSIFSNRQNRIDSYVRPLTPERQVQILKKMNYIFKKYKNQGVDEFYGRLTAKSGLWWTLQYLKFHQLEASFFMSPTFSEKVVKNTQLSSEEWLARVEGFKRLFDQYPFQYIDLSSRKELVQHMRHYDNITVEGHKVLAEILNKELNLN